MDLEVTKRRSFLIRDILEGFENEEEGSDSNSQSTSAPLLNPEVVVKIEVDPDETTSNGALYSEELKIRKLEKIPKTENISPSKSSSSRYPDEIDKKDIPLLTSYGFTGIKILDNHFSNPNETYLDRTVSMEATPIDEYRNFQIHEDEESKSPYGPDRKPQRCSICSMFQDRGKLKKVEMDSEKLILIVGFVLNQKMATTKAREMATNKRDVFSCSHHYSDVFHDIRNSLNLNFGERITAASGDRIKRLMEIVNSVRPEIKQSNFLVLLEMSAVLNKHRIKDLPPIEIKIETPSRPQSPMADYFDYPSPPPAPFRPPICFLCSHPCEHPRELTSGYLRLIMAIAWILSEKWTEQEAIEILKSSEKLMSCHVHFLEATDCIFDSMGIENEDVDLVSESNILVIVLMRIVENVRPGTTCIEFVKCFRQFYTLNRDVSMRIARENEQ